MSISREAALCFDHFVCSTLSGPGLRASRSQSLNGELVAVAQVSPSKLPATKTVGKLPRRESIRQRIQAHAIWQRTGKCIQRQVFAKSYL